jgi:hypothetical protein
MFMDLMSVYPLYKFVIEFTVKHLNTVAGSSGQQYRLFIGLNFLIKQNAALVGVNVLRACRYGYGALCKSFNRSER